MRRPSERDPAFRRRVAPALVLAALLLAPASAHAAPAVTNTNDSGPGSLRNAIAGANGGDTIALPAGTYGLASQLTVPVSLTIDGSGGSLGSRVITGRDSVRVFDVTAGSGTVTLRGLTIRDGFVTGNGAGIRHSGAGALTLDQTMVIDNVANATGGTGANGGGGIYHGSAAALNIIDSTVSQNTATIAGSASGGGGIYVNGTAATIQNSTISRNLLKPGPSPLGSGDGGAGIFADDGGGSLNNVTVVANTAQGVAGGGIFNRNAAPGVALRNTIVANNVAPAGVNCAGGIASQGSNLENANTCQLGAGELRNTPSPVGALEDNGGPTLTHALFPNNQAIDNGDGSFCESNDQRGVARAQGLECDIGSYEFDGQAAAQIPDCTRTGVIPITMTAAPGEGVTGLKFRVAGGPLQTIALPGGSTQSATVVVPEGRVPLEYFGNFTNGDEADHDTPTVVVDRTNPIVAVKNPNRFKRFVIRRKVKVNVNANDSISGLTSDPSGAQAISTAKRGLHKYAPTVVDKCGNSTAAAAFDYRILAPALGKRLVVEPLTGSVRVTSSGSSSGARASQKGQSFAALKIPREVPFGSLVSARRGKVRITTSRNRTKIQDGSFLGGLFQVLQSRKKVRKGLTELRLKGSSFRSCTATPRRKRTRATAARLSSRKIRRLRGNAKGRFRTRGRHSAATVRGTIWSVTDRCDGTLTSVKRGKVAVRDFRRRKTIIVRKGKSYLAKAPG